ncbi:hypothetical protein LUZ60_014130 [Juncus effusus]|nr:hypothetical protein LUZ60_014130 [Juncus effusus]
MTIINQLINPGSCSSACSLNPKDPSAHSTISQFPISLKSNGAAHTKQNLTSNSLTCRVRDILRQGPSELAHFQPFALNFIQSIFNQEKLTKVTDQDKCNGTNSLVLTVSVSSAVELGQTQIDMITKKMKGITGFPNLRVVNTVDPSLIAGFVIRYGLDESSVIDLSVKGELAALANQVEASDNQRHV